MAQAHPELAAGAGEGRDNTHPAAGSTTQSADPSTGPDAPTADSRSAARCSVSLRFLLEFSGKHVRSGGDEMLKTSDLVASHIIPFTKQQRCRYTQLLESRDVWSEATKGMATPHKVYFISHAFGCDTHCPCPAPLWKRPSSDVAENRG